MKRRITALLMAGLLVMGLGACGQTPPVSAPEEIPPAEQGLSAGELNVGMVLVGDTADSYNKNHVNGMKAACEALGLDFNRQVTVRTNVKEDETAVDIMGELAKAGCQVIFANSAGHEPFVTKAAARHPKVQFCHASGSACASDNLANTHNYFAKVHEARYLSGIAAGLKTETNMLGYVAAMPLAEVISGFTAFYLGARSVNPEVTMLVSCTGAWADPVTEQNAAQALIDQGCDVVSHHTDTSAVCAAAEANRVFAVGYNSDMVAVAPDSALVSAQIDWSVYYAYALTALLEGEEIAQDWCGGYAEGACGLSPLNTAILGEGTEEAIAAGVQGLSEGTVQVFAGPLYGMNAEGDELLLAEGEFFVENETSSCPAFDYIVDGVTVLS